MKTISFQQMEGLGILQFGTDNSNSFEFISSAEAIQKNFVEVKENSEAGSVNNLVVLNHSPFFVLFIDGDILAGAKQNRVLNTSVLLAPLSKTSVPVSCVEAGRWSYRSNSFRQTDYTAPHALRSLKSKQVSENLKSSKGAYAEQAAVWNSVSDYAGIMDVASATSSLSDVFDKSESAYEKFVSAFKAEENANGVAFFINHELKSVEQFNRTNIFREYFPKLLKGISFDVFGKKVQANGMTEAEASYKTIQLFDELLLKEKSIHPGVGIGEEWRYDFAGVSGFELNYNGNLIHSSYFMEVKSTGR